MPVRDTYHSHLRDALLRDNWTITDDPLRLQYGTKDLYVDLGAERLIGASKGQHRIAVEIKSFMGPSDVRDLEEAIGQYVLYENVLAVTHPGRLLYLAVRQVTFNEVFEEPLGKLLLDRKRLQLLVFDDVKREIVQWIPPLPTVN